MMRQQAVLRLLRETSYAAAEISYPYNTLLLICVE